MAGGATAGKPLPILFLYALAVGLAALSLYLTHSFYEDDSFISLRYARNLMDGYGLTWNPGSRIEGYTNFLMVILEAGLGKLGVDLMLASRIISFAAFFGLVFVLWRHVQRQPGGPYQRTNAALAVALVATSLPLLAWCWGGLESVLFAFFTAAAVCLTLEWLADSASGKKSFAIGTLLALSMLTRPEGVMVFGLTAAFLACKPGQWKQLGWMTAAFLIIFLPYMAWRVWYFGDLLPNTYYTKTYGIAPSILLPRGLLYLLQCLLLPPWLILFGGWFFIGMARAKMLSPAVAYLALLAAVFLGYIVSVGGDFMPYERFLVPVIPLLALLAYHGLEWLGERSGKRWGDISFVLIAFLLLQPAVAAESDGLARGALSGLAVADYVKSHWPKDASVALNAIGALPYTAPDHRYIDMLGLTDRHIARRIIRPDNLRLAGQTYTGHMKGDGAYVLSHRPDYIIFGVSWGDDKPEFLSDAEIARSRAFKAHYKEITVWVTPPANLLPQLQAMAKVHSPGLALNNINQLRFTYFQRVK